MPLCQHPFERLESFQMGLSELPLIPTIVVFSVAAVAIALVGIRLAVLAERLSVRTGLGQALTGALFLGASTSLSGITTSVTAAAAGLAELAAGNAVGGIAAQTAFLAVADIFYRRANLEHAAASDENMLQGALLMALLSISLLAAHLPAVSVLGVHPASIVVLIVYGAGQKLVQNAQGMDMWRPRITEQTQRERVTTDDAADQTPIVPLIGRFAVLAALIAVLGWLLARTGGVLAMRTGINQTVLGGLFTAVATSFPELVTAVAAVRIGALTLAVGNIMGGNAFDVIFLSVADIAYREGSIFHAMGTRPQFLILLTLLLTSVLLLGLIRRQKHGFANIGFESLLVLLCYAGGFVLIVTVL